MTWVDKYVAVMALVALLAPPVFAVVYVTMRFWRTWEGRFIMAQKLVFTGFLLSTVLYWWVGNDYFGRDTLRIVLFTAFPVVTWGMTILLIRTRRRTRQGLVPHSEVPPEAVDQPSSLR